MKKITALILSLVLVCCCCAFFASAEDAKISEGKTYTYTGFHSADGAYPDETGKSLVDGVIGETADVTYSSAIWNGLNFKGDNSPCPDANWADAAAKDSATNSITLDLGAKYGCTKYVIYALGFNAGIALPKTVEILVSADGASFTSVGKTSESEKIVNAKEGDDEAFGIYAFTVEASANANFVKFELVQGGAWCFVSEIEVFGGEAAAETSSEAPESSEEASSAAPESSADVSEEASSVSPESSADVSEEASSAAPESSADTSSEASAPADDTSKTDDTKAPDNTWVIILITVIALAVIAVVVVVIVKKKK